MSDNEFGEIQQDDELLDERRNRIRDKITVDAVKIFVRLGIANVFIMESMYQWCESYWVSSYLIVAAAYIYWHIRNGVNGSLLGVKGVGKRVGEAMGVLVIGLFAVLITVPVLALGDGNIFEHFFIHDGMVSELLLAAATLILLMADAVTVCVLEIRHKIKEKSAGE